MFAAAASVRSVFLVKSIAHMRRHPVSSLCRFLPVLGVASLSLLLVKGQQNTGDTRVGVIAGIDETVKKARLKNPAAFTEKQLKGSYTLALVRELPNLDGEKFAVPVDAEVIARKVGKELDRQGFWRAKPPQPPDFVITVDYGRGTLPNPYTGTPGEPVDNLSDTHAIGMLRQHKTYVGLEEKIQRAGYEKLFIRMTAWKYPASPKDKPKRIWRTLMTVDDPDHRDLGVVADVMLAAGGAFFNQATAIEETEVTKPLPDGKVRIGEAVEVAPAKK
jgi:hypothetical protein